MTTSPDGMTWTAETGNIAFDLKGIHGANGTAIVVGEDNLVLKTTYPDTDSPVITTQPASQSFAAGATVTLSAGVAGAAPIDYQWFKDGQPLANDARISGANTATLTITGAVPEDAGEYWLAVNNPAGGRNSLKAILTGPPIFTQQPQGTVQFLTSGATFTVEVSGTGPFTYVWKKNGSTFSAGNVTGQGTPSLDVSGITAADAGIYTVEVSNAAGLTVSDPAGLSVYEQTGINVDSSFPVSPIPFQANPAISTATVDSMGRILIGGWFKINKPGGGSVDYIARLNSDGTLDGTFVPPVIDGSVEAIHILGNGDILASGFFGTANGAQILGIMRLNGTTGALDATYTTTTDQYNGPYEFRVSPGGHLFMSGGYSKANDDASLGFFTKLDANGNVDATFDPTPIDNEVTQFSFQSNGGIILGGNFPTQPSSRLARLQADGTADTDFNGAGAGITAATSGNFRFPSVLTTLVAPDNSVYAGGFFDKYRGSPVLKMMRVDGATGARDTNFDPVFTSDSGRVWDMVFAGANILTVGNFHSVNSTTQNGVTLITPEGDISPDLNVGTAAGPGYILDIAPGVNNDFFLAGSFTSFNDDTDIAHLARIVAAAGSTPLAVVQSPGNVSAGAGRRVTFTVAATGSGALSFQWQKDMIDLPGETGPSLTLNNVMAANAGQYRVVVTAGGQSVNSNPATLTVDVSGGGQTFANWAAANSLPQGQDGPGDDADGDGVPNIVEFALGTDPASATSKALPADRRVRVGNDEYPAIAIIRRKNVTGANVEVKAYGAIPFNSEVTTVQEGAAEDLGDGTERVIIRASQPLAPDTIVFFVTRVQQP